VFAWSKTDELTDKGGLTMAAKKPNILVIWGDDIG
jgi:hypothetical protein